MNQGSPETRQRILRTLRAAVDRLQAVERARTEAIAIIGMGCRFPGGADDPESFWTMLRDGVDAVGEFPRDCRRLESSFDPDPDSAGRTYTRHGAFLRDVDRFDAQFFGLSPREAASLDPQQRVLLETTWEALERAGQTRAQLSGSETGVFVGITSCDYGRRLAREAARVDAYYVTGNTLNAAAGRLSYLLGLRGPSLAVDTACSSSLVAVHLACQSLRTGECDAALAAGVNLILAPEGFIALAKSRVLSSDGRCKTFDEAADGIGRAEGCGVLVLKRLSTAERDGDRVLAVIRGTAVNQDGASGGLTVPYGPAQRDVVRRALANARVAPAEIDLVEAHGTGTALGDPIELRALGEVFAPDRPPDRPLVVGAVKANIGHAESAAGVAGLIKTVLCLRHEAIPPQIHFRTPSPHVDWHALPIVIPTSLRPWPAGPRPRLAGISGFSFSGTNAHVIVEETPVGRQPDAPGAPDSRVESGEPRRETHLLTLSAVGSDALHEMARRYARRLTERPAPALADICFSAATTRDHHPDRIGLVCTSADDAAEALGALAEGRHVARAVRGCARPDGVVFLCSGDDSACTGMGRGLYASEPVFRRAVDRCAEIAGHALVTDEEPGGDPASTHEALFAVEYAVAQLWHSWGIAPAALLGRGVGEYVAAHLAGVFDLETSLKLVAERARLLGGNEGALAPLRAVLARVVMQRPQIPIISSVTGMPAGAELISPDYWLRHAARDLNGRGPGALARTGHRLFVEIGPQPTLARIGRTEVADDETQWIASLAHGEEDETIQLALAQLYVRGVPVDWQAFHAGRGGRRVALPTYAFQRTRHWFDLTEPPLTLPSPRKRGEGKADSRGGSLAPLCGERAGVRGDTEEAEPDAASAVVPAREVRAEDATPLFDITWVEQRVNADLRGVSRWLIVSDERGIGRDLAARARARGDEVDLIRLPDDADESEKVIDRAINRALDAAIRRPDAKPLEIVHLRGLDVPAGTDAADWQRARVIAWSTALRVAQIAADADGSRRQAPRRLWFITCGAQPVASRSPSHPIAVLQAPLWGLGRVVALEYPDVWGGAIDLDPADLSAAPILLEIDGTPRGGARDTQVAWSGGRRFVPRLTRREADRAAAPPRFAADGCYVLTGGLGGLGLIAADWMVANGARRLVLAGRSDPSPEARQRIEAMRRVGANIRVIRADLAEAEDAARVMTEADRLGRVRGILHAAGAIRDGALPRQEPAQFETVMAGKGRGALHLDRLTRGRDLDFVVFFSSVASLLGSPGQSNYAAANALLDALAAERRRRGEAAISINWGPWADAGMTARLAEAQRLAMSARGLRAFTADEGVRLLGQLLHDDAPQVAAVSMDVAVVQQAIGGVTLPMLDQLVQVALPRMTSARATTVVERLDAMSRPVDRQDVLAYLQERVRRILRLGDAPALVPRLPLQAQGLDSMMATELKNCIRAELDVDIALTSLLAGATLDSVTDAVHAQLTLVHVSRTAPQAADTEIEEVIL